nr:speckle-type POZ protein-like [Parasteatoda tepidariorum]
MAKNEYVGAWTISTPAYPNDFKSIVTPTFAPFSGKNLEFHFKASYKEEVSRPISNFYEFKLKLVKLSNASISPVLEVLVDVNYSDGSNFVNYPSMVLNDGMTFATFNDVTRIKNLKSIYEQSVFSDFVFKVGDKSFPVHKIILSAHSPVFMKMMTHDFMESKTNSVTITDAAPEVFELFLRSLYAGELENKSWDSLKELYYLVDKYDVEFLNVECTDAVISLLSVDLVCEILKLAYSFSDSDLKTAAINFAVNHIKKIVPREDWKELVKSHPMIGYDVTANFIPK